MVVKATHKAFTPRYVLEQRDELSFGQYRGELLKRRVNAWEVTARRVARQVFQCVKRQIEANNANNGLTSVDRQERNSYCLCTLNLKSTAKVYGCKVELLDYAVGCVRQLVENARRNGVGL